MKTLIQVALLAAYCHGTGPGLWLRAKAGASHSLAHGDGWSSGKVEGKIPWAGDYSGWGRAGEAQLGLQFPQEAATRISLFLYGHLALKEAEIGAEWAPVLGRRLRTWSSGGGLGMSRANGPARSWYAQAGFSYLQPSAAFEDDSVLIVPGYAPALGFRAGIGWEARPFQLAPSLGIGLAVDYDRYVVERRSARLSMQDGFQTRLEPSGDREILENSFSLHVEVGYAFRLF